MARWRYAVDADRHTTGSGDFGADLGGRQHTAVARFRALAKLEFDQFNLVAPRPLLEFLGAKRAVTIAATEIPRTDFPDQIATVFAVIDAISAFSGVVSEVALFGADVERANSVRTQRAKAHRRNIEDGSRIRLAAVGPADDDAERLLGGSFWRHR